VEIRKSGEQQHIALRRRAEQEKHEEKLRVQKRVFAGLVAGVAVVAAIGNSGNPLQVLAAVLLLSPVWLLALAGLLFLHARLEKRATRRIPPGPG
jgi:hypothetical protein